MKARRRGRILTDRTEESIMMLMEMFGKGIENEKRCYNNKWI